MKKLCLNSQLQDLSFRFETKPSTTLLKLLKDM